MVVLLLRKRRHNLIEDSPRRHPLRLHEGVRSSPRRAIVHTPPVAAQGFLDALSLEEANALRASAMQRYGANVTLIHQADDGGPVVLLVAGRVKITVVTDAGRQAIVAVCGPGDLVGELAAIDDGPRSTTVTTLELVDALVVELCERFGTQTENGIEIQLPLSQEDLASWVGASREAISKAFQQLRSLHVLETGRRRVTVLDLGALERRAH
jgi:CRP/FNR family transcriptional regulator, cyclic AMP receptor protein